ADDEPARGVNREPVAKSYVEVGTPEPTSVVDVRLPDGALTRWDAPPQTVLTTKDGTRCCSIARLQEMTKDHAVFGSLMLDNAPNGQGQFHAVFPPPEPCTMTDPNGLVGEVLRVLIDIKTRSQLSP